MSAFKHIASLPETRNFLTGGVLHLLNSTCHLAVSAFRRRFFYLSDALSMRRTEASYFQINNKKSNSFMEKKVYVEPLLQVFEFETERGFAASQVEQPEDSELEL